MPIQLPKAFQELFTPIQLPEAFQELFMPSRYKAYFGGRGSGKSHSFAMGLVLLGVQKPLRIMCCRELQKSIQESVKELIDMKILELERADPGLVGFYSSTKTEIKGKNGTEFFFSGVRNNPHSIKSTEGIDILWGEEADTFSQRSLDLIIPTVRKPGSELWFTWNPNSEDDAVDKKFRGENPPPDSIVREVHYSDNLWFPDVLRKEMEYDKSYDEGKYRHVWLGEYADVQDGKMFTNDILEWQEQFLRDDYRQVGNWRVYDEYNVKCQYVIGADVSEGVGLDSSTAIIINLTKGEICAEFVSSEVEPDLFGYELYNMSNKYGGCLIAPERNSCGLTTVTKLRELGGNLYYEEEQKSGQSKPTKKLGWRTHSGSKPLMLYGLKDGLTDKAIKIISRPLYKELKTYNPDDLRQVRFDPEQTRHWDRVMALAIAWQMRDYVGAHRKASVDDFYQADSVEEIIDKYSII